MSEDKKEENSEELVQVPKGILEQFEEMKKALKEIQNGSPVKMPSRVEKGSRSAFVRFYENKDLVVGIENSRNVEEVNIAGRKEAVVYADLVVYDEEKEKTRTIKGKNLIKFLDGSTPVKAKLLEEKIIDETYSDGIANAVNLDEKGNRSFLEEEIDLQVEKISHQYKIEIIDGGELKGKKFTIHQTALNL